MQGRGRGRARRGIENLRVGEGVQGSKGC